MKRVLTILAIAALVLSFVVSSSAQTFQQCADVDQHGSVNIADLVFMLNVFLNNTSLPAGRGDIDFRQDFNLGDVRYLAGYIFGGYPEGGCPPFASYPLLSSPDSIFLPQVSVPAGSGSVIAPISIRSFEPISELLLISRFVATNCVATIDSVTFANWPTPNHSRRIISDEVRLLWFSTEDDDVLPPGTRSVAFVHISYSASTGGTVGLVPEFYDQYGFTHQVYGPFQTHVYNDMKIGTPHIFVRDVQTVSQMSVAPDSLYFVILHGSGDPAPKTFTVQSDGAVFVWSTTQPAWINVTPTTGISGNSVTVQPLTAGLAPGIHTGTIEVASTEAYNSPRSVKVVLKIQPQYPAFDANCDGHFNISDIVYLLVYIFGGPAPCDPCLRNLLQ